jgi:TPP-dependent pyruvate/acetoin dehydrogenase alpha subunit
MGRAKKVQESENVDSDLTYFTKSQRELKDAGGDKVTSFGGAFQRTVSRARSMGAFILVRAMVLRILDAEEVTGDRTSYYRAASQASSAALRGRWDQVEALRNKYATGSESMDKIFQIFGF